MVSLPCQFHNLWRVFHIPVNFIFFQAQSSWSSSEYYFYWSLFSQQEFWCDQALQTWSFIHTGIPVLRSSETNPQHLSSNPIRIQFHYPLIVPQFSISSELIYLFYKLLEIKTLPVSIYENSLEIGPPFFLIIFCYGVNL